MPRQSRYLTLLEGRLFPRQSSHSQVFRQARDIVFVFVLVFVLHHLNEDVVVPAYKELSRGSPLQQLSMGGLVVNTGMVLQVEHGERVFAGFVLRGVVWNQVAAAGWQAWRAPIVHKMLLLRGERKDCLRPTP